MNRAASALVCGALTFGIHTAIASDDGPVVVVVNGVRIEPWEVGREFQKLLPQTSFHGRVEGDRRSELEQQAAEVLVVNELKRQWAGREDLAVDGATVDSELAEVRARFVDETAYHAALNEHGITEAELRRAIMRDRLASDVDQRILSEVPDPELGDVKRFFESNRGDFVTPEARHVYHVLIHVPPSADTAVWERAGRAAEDVAENVRQGRTDLAAEAERRRIDIPPRYRDQTGDLGMIHRGALQANVDEVVFAAEVGEVLGPIRTIFGFSVLEVTSIEPPRQMEFAQVSEAISSRLKREWREAALAEFEENLRSTASIEWGQSSAAP
jgi:parvulin-like peptidyl-prolyl isomerase